MDNVLIAVADWSDEATITATNEDASMPATNLQKKQPGDLWQTEDLTSIQLDFDRGSAKPLNLVALLFTNLTSSATWRVRVDVSDNTFASPDYDSGNQTFQGSPLLTSLVWRHGFVRPSTANMSFGEEGYNLEGFLAA